MGTRGSPSWYPALGEGEPYCFFARAGRAVTAVTSCSRLPTVMIVQETWQGVTEAMLDAARSEFGISRLRKVDKQARLWTNEVKKVRGKEKFIATTRSLLPVIWLPLPCFFYIDQLAQLVLPSL